MKRYFAIAACVGTLAALTAPAQANDRVQMSISIGVPGIFAPPVYVAPPPPPAVVYYPAPYGYYYHHRPHYYYHGYYEGHDEGHGHYQHGHDDDGHDNHDGYAWHRTEMRR